jgi:hypothetical protein
MSSIQIGDSQVAADIYGTGVRLGVYFQVVGLCLSAAVGKGRGIKLSCGATMMALLISWTNLVTHQNISPAESIVILTLLEALFFPISAAFLCEEAWIGEGIAMSCCILANLWTAIAYIWFWATLYEGLPALGTPGFTWFFKQVSIDGWYRPFNLVMLTLLLLLPAAYLSIKGWVYVAVAVKAWAAPGAFLKLTKKDREELESTRYSLLCISIVGIALYSIPLIEMTIKWNELHPDNDFSHPGQTIPLVVGAFVLIDGILALLAKSAEEPSRDNEEPLREPITVR